MTPVDRRAEILKLIAELDQNIQEAGDLATSELLATAPIAGADRYT